MTRTASLAFSFQNCVATILLSLGKLLNSQVVFCMFQTSGNKVQLTDECVLWQKMLRSWGVGG